MDMWPEGFEVPYIWVWVDYDDTTPLETESSIVRPIEDQLATIPGIKKMSSTAKSTGGSIELQFHQSVDMSDAYNQVVDRMERVMAELPDDVERYWAFRWNPADEPKVWLGMTISPEVNDPYPLVTDLVQKQLERIPDVGKVDVWGIAEKSIWIDFRKAALEAHDVDLGSLLTLLASDNIQLPGGRITDMGQLRYLRSLARFEDIGTIRDYPVKTGVRLQDVADIRFAAEPYRSIHRINGNAASALGITKESGGNTVAVCRQVREVVESLKKDPRLEGFSFYYFFDQGKEIEKALGNLRNTAFQGGAFAILVLFLFLREWRMTMLIAGCIPFSLLITVVVLYFTGGTLNLLSMMGLMIAVGMVVDNAIVVVETIFRARQDGASPRRAAIEGTSEVSLAITLSTMTTMVVFLPIILMSQDAMFSFFMSKLGFPVVWALAASLLVAMVFTPLTTTILKKGQIIPDAPWITWLGQHYEWALRRLLNFRLDSTLAIVALVFLTFQLPVKSVGCSDDNEGDVSRFTVRFQVPGTFNDEERLDTIRSFEKLVSENLDNWGVDSYRTRLREGSSQGYMWVTLKDWDERPESAIPRDEVLEDAKKKLPELPGVPVALGWDADPLGSRSITLNLYGEETELLYQFSREVVRRLEALPAIMGAKTSVDVQGAPEIQLTMQRENAARYGLMGEQVGRSLAFAMRGIPLNDIWLEGHETDVYARFAEEDRSRLDDLLDFSLGLPTAENQEDGASSSIPIRAVANPVVTRGWGEIHRQDRRTGITVQVDLAEGISADNAYSMAESALEDLNLPRGYGWEKGSSFSEQEESDAAQLQAILLSVTFVFLLMGILFESFILPLSIITTVPMALLGVFWTLYFTGTSLDVMAGVGLVVLVGVVVNNGIVLVDLVTRLRKTGMERCEALVQAGRRRMRPILMTALTTFFGLMPMALGRAAFLDVPYAPLGRVVAGGLATATVLTLFFVPLLYTILDDLRETSRRLWAWTMRSR